MPTQTYLHAGNLFDTDIKHDVSGARTAFAAGRPVIIIDTVAGGETVADVCIAAEELDVAKAAFLVEHTCGILSATVDVATSDRLDLPLLRPDLRREAGRFCVAVDARGDSTGISARARAETISRLADPAASAGDFSRPGHVIPVLTGGLFALSRWSRYDAAAELSRSVGRSGVVAVASLVDGLVGATGDYIDQFASWHRFPVIAASAFKRF
ncbi:3,4-dihydroxy-2-butanone-4-phosphate synthase [Mycobacterium sp. SMC-4]|uniref:3,4-dihydroxy-2-butanone-4-phosphate synthase n=1 Tax=Mycobacterium sp. SMC-4 TaxID=2857059 RepID=UPI0021B4161E|nr:3,4-dihydroxy-2-butanone-4-phosphate synthase [Mycobacterium sp. SMC-4]UXA17914.1 3,4-dihydroxy-2-butanone-4-phosphate synthase [Mycobacterium sp. SMC-4]